MAACRGRVRGPARRRRNGRVEQAGKCSIETTEEQNGSGGMEMVIHTDAYMDGRDGRIGGWREGGMHGWKGGWREGGRDGETYMVLGIVRKGVADASVITPPPPPPLGGMQAWRERRAEKNSTSNLPLTALGLHSAPGTVVAARKYGSIRSAVHPPGSEGTTVGMPGGFSTAAHVSDSYSTSIFRFSGT